MFLRRESLQRLQPLERLPQARRLLARPLQVNRLQVHQPQRQARVLPQEVQLLNNSFSLYILNYSYAKCMRIVFFYERLR